MSRRARTFAAAVSLTAGALSVPMGVALAAPSPTGLEARNVAVCPGPPSAGYALCHAIEHVLVDRNGKPVTSNANSGPSGYGPSDLQSAYSLVSVSTAGGGRTVAIVDAYDDPNATSDLNTYRSHYYGSSTMASCAVSGSGVTSNGSGPCFAKVNQSGAQGNYPRANGGWAQEESLDVDMVSAICPECNILLVEASSNSFANLGAAVNTAASLGAVAISNSYGGSDASDSSYGSYYDHPGVAVTASTGDSGYGVEYPASSDYTVGVGGTSLSKGGSGWTETAWKGAGSGCSSYNSQPTWQSANSNITGVCARRAVADVSADADPNTGVAVYDSYSYQGMSGWLVFGGTSVASPVIASVFALGGATGPSAATTTPYPAADLYSSSGALNDVTRGSNGSCGDILCNAGPGWDGPSGLGSPDGTTAFTDSGSSTGSAPSAPTLSQPTVSGTDVSLSWTSVSGVTNYDVYRDNGQIASVQSPSTSYTDSGLTSGTYSYYVTACSSSGECSSPSNTESAAVGSTTAGPLTVTVSDLGSTAKGRNYQTQLQVDAANASVPVGNASTTITVYSGSCSGTSVASGTGTTGSNGTVTFTFNTKSTGDYCAQADVTAPDGTTGSGSATFTVP